MAFDGAAGLPGTTWRVDDVADATHWELEGRGVELLALLTFVDPACQAHRKLTWPHAYIRQAPVGGRLAVGMLLARPKCFGNPFDGRLLGSRPRELGELGAQPFRGAGFCGGLLGMVVKFQPLFAQVECSLLQRQCKRQSRMISAYNASELTRRAMQQARFIWFPS